MNDGARGSRFKLISMALVLAVSTALAGCGGGGKTKSSNAAAPVTATPSPSPGAPDPGTPEPAPGNPAPGTPAPAPGTPDPGSPEPAPGTPDPGPGAPTDPSPSPAPAPIPGPTEPEPAPQENSVPKISGTGEASVDVNSTYSFLPAASDADGDQLTFQIENKPRWATFSTLDGKLYGTPVLADEGTYADIRISVSDGKVQVSLPAFSIDVLAPTATDDAATLSWSAPTQNSDGSTLTDLAGFLIVYGPTQTELYESVRIDNPSIDRFVLDDLPAGTYYFAVKAYNSAGVESGTSNVVSKILR